MQICEGVQRPIPSHPNKTEQTNVLFPLYILLYILKNVSKKLKEMITKEVFLHFWLIFEKAILISAASCTPKTSETLL